MKLVHYNEHLIHDDVIKWKHFPRNWPFVRKIHRSPVNFPHKGQWRGALMFSLIYVWINDWANNREAGDLRRYPVHYDVIVMKQYRSWWSGAPVPGHQWPLYGVRFQLFYGLIYQVILQWSRHSLAQHTPKNHKNKNRISHQVNVLLLVKDDMRHFNITVTELRWHSNRIWWLYRSTLVEWYRQLVLPIDHESLGPEDLINVLETTHIGV